jgi:site-specific DNA-cytosine methylase
MKWVPVTSDAISDLRNLELTWKAQPYTDPPTWWSHRQRTSTGSVDGHQTPQLSAVHQQRLDDIVNGDQAVDWPPGFVWDQVLKRYYEKHGDLPDSHKYMSKAKGKQHLTRDKVMIDAGFNMGGYAQTRHWPWNRPGYVITGHGPGQAWHPDNRHFTHRETARVMGFPDDWLIEPIKDHPQLAAMWGKGISVDCGRWVATWVLNSMNGNPGSNRGKPLSDGTDRVIDVSQDYKKVPGGIRIRGNETED